MKLLVRRRFEGADFDRLCAPGVPFQVVVLDGDVRAAVLGGVHRDAEAIWTFGEVIDDDLLDALPRLRVVANQGVGYNTLDLDALERRGVEVVIPRGVNADAVADHAIGLLVALRHRIVAGDRFVRAGNWLRRHRDEPMGEDLTGTVLGIVGMGAIGREVTRRAHAFRMRVVYTSRNEHPDVAADRVELDDLLRAADAVTIHCPLTDATRGMIGARELALMKPTAVLVNTARGAIVDEAALCAALAAGGLHGAALDVFVDEPHVPVSLLDHPRVIVTPHIADYQPGPTAALTRACVDGLLAAVGD